MVDVKSHSFELGRTDDGRWAAASCSSPCFYFVSESREAVLGKTKRALDFYMKSAGTIELDGPASHPTITRARPVETVRTSELMEAA